MAIWAIFFLAGTANARDLVHVVEQGETFSEIAARYFGAPVYHRRTGSLIKLQKLNPKIRNANIIRVGQKLFLGPEDRRVVASKISEPAESAELPPPEQEQDPEPALATPEPAVAPVDHAVSQAPASASANRASSRAEITLGGEFFRLDETDVSTGGKAIVASNLSPKVRLRWDLLWSSSSTWRLSASYLRYSLQDLSSGTSRSLSGASGGLLDVDAEFVHHWSTYGRTGIAIGYKESIFAHSTSATQIAFDRVAEPVARLSQEFDLARRENAAFGLRLTGASLFPGRGPGYSTKTGFGGEAGLYLMHVMGKTTLRGDIYYGIDKQDSTILKQEERRAGVLLNFSWGFGD